MSGSGIIGVEQYGTMPGYAGGTLSLGRSLLKQDVSHSTKIAAHLKYEAKLEGILRLAARVLIDGDRAEQLDVAEQIEAALTNGDAA